MFGGAAGGGKSEALLRGATEYIDVPGYSALLLRRTFKELAKSGALMDRAHDWFDGTDWGNAFGPHEGAGFLGVSQYSVDLCGTISNWAVLPEIPEQAAGDVMTFYTISAATGDPDRLQVWYSSMYWYYY